MNQYFGLIAGAVFLLLICAFGELLAYSPGQKQTRQPNPQVDYDLPSRLRDQLTTDVRELRKRIRSVNRRINDVERRLKIIERPVMSGIHLSSQATWDAIIRDHDEIRSRIEKLEKDLPG